MGFWGFGVLGFWGNLVEILGKSLGNLWELFGKSWGNRGGNLGEIL